MIPLDGRTPRLLSLVGVADAGAPIGVAPDAVRPVAAARVVDRHAARPDAVDGVNTGGSIEVK